MDRKEKALNLKHNGCNCAQAVAAAFADLTDFDEETIKALSTGFGTGGGTMRGTCGALSAVYLLTSCIYKKADPFDPALRVKIMAANKEITNRFFEKNSSVICKELKGIESGRMLRSCDGCVEDAAEFLYDYLVNNNIIKKSV